MAFSIAGMGAAEFESVSLRGGRPGLGYYQLAFDVSLLFWGAANEAHRLTVHIDGGEVLARRPGVGAWVLLGRLHREEGTYRSMGADKHRLRFGWVMGLDLAPERMEALERLRAGGDLEFSVVLRGTVSKPSTGEFEHAEDRRQCLVTQSEWARICTAIGYRDILLLEVPVLRADESAELAQAAAALREAHEHFLQGRYRATVEGCRHALEALGHALGDGTGTKDDLRAMVERADKLTKSERMMVLRRAAFVMSSLAAHSKDDVSLRTSWDRHDALGLLTMTAALVKWIAERRLSGELD